MSSARGRATKDAEEKRRAYGSITMEHDGTMDTMTKTSKTIVLIVLDRRRMAVRHRDDAVSP